jgi:hypothetical protein
MVQAILEGRKTQTRRIVKPKRNSRCRMSLFNAIAHISGKWFGVDFNNVPFINDLIEQPKCKPGDILWVRETWKCVQYDSMDGNLGYEVEFRDGERKYFEFDDNERFHQFGKFAFKEGWQSSLFMPREAARIFLKVTNVRVERVQEITLEDIEHEGLYCEPPYTKEHYAYAPGMRIHWIKLWDSLNAKRGYGWDVNPWVWAYTFERVDKPKEESL